MIDIDFASLRTIGLTQAVASQLSTIVITDHTLLARVVEIHRDWIVIHDGAGQHKARTLGRLLHALQAGGDSLAVGDWVLAACHASGEYWLGEWLEPLTQIARRSTDGRRQSLASNVDTALLVMGLDQDFNLRRLERYVALAEGCGVAPVVVLTKADTQALHGARLDQVHQRLPGRIPAFAVDARDGAAAASLSPWMGAGQTLILLGSSGAGKSTLTNTLAGSGQQTGGVRQGDDRGRHTTTVRSLHQCAGGACIIDTPGLRTWQLDADEDALEASFDDIASLARDCRFRDCRHEQEPGCAVREAIDPDRLRNYRKLLREVQRSTQTPLERIAEKAKWKALIKSIR